MKSSVSGPKLLSDSAKALLAEMSEAPDFSVKTKGRAEAARDLVSRGLARGYPGNQITLTPAGAWTVRNAKGVS